MKIDEIKTKLNSLKSRIEETKKIVSEAEGEITGNMKRLNDDFNLTSIEQAKAKVAQLNKEDQTAECTINKKFNKLANEVDI